MSETIKVVKFKTNVSFVASNGILYFGGQVVQLPQEDYDGQVEVCSDFGLPVPELIAEVEVVAQEETPTGESEESKKRGRGRPSAEAEDKAEDKAEAPVEESSAAEGQSDEL